MKFLAFALFLSASSALRAEDSSVIERPLVDPAILMARAEALRDAVADRSVSDASVKLRAHGFFDSLPGERLVLAVGTPRPMQREPIDGKLGSIRKMLDTADERIADWKRVHKEPPPPELEAAVAEARLLQSNKRLDYDMDGELTPSQMGIFKYMRDSLTEGAVKLNERMRIIGALVGPAFSFATVIHESEHSLSRKAGRLTPEQEIAGEISAFRRQFLWLQLMDPKGERRLTLHYTLQDWLRKTRDDKVRIALIDALAYLEHLSDVVHTGGDEEELKKLIKKLGYRDSKHSHGDGHDHEPRGGASPASA